MEIPYLGITLAPTLPRILALNYTQLLSQMSKILDAWKRLQLAWFGRIAAVKMTVLPRILYPPNDIDDTPTRTS